MDRLRENLILFEWEPDTNGQRQWVLHDPLNNKFFYLDATAFDLLRQASRLDPGILTALASTAQQVPPPNLQEIYTFVQFLKSNGLIRSTDAEANNDDAITKPKRHKLFLRWIEAYISFTVPLLSPDHFLEQTLWLVRKFFTARFVAISLLFGIAGVLLASRDMQAISEEARSTFTLSNLPIFMMAVIATKLVHEFSHAYMAKLQGSHVPIMGIKFIVLFPLPYTDTSDTWRIYSHKGRRNVALAGVVSEFILAFWATFLWNFAPNDTLSQFLFVIAASTWISSVAINAIPFMRFDGYFVLMDILQMPNLHSRAGAMGKWFLRKLFLGIDVEAPEGGSTRKLLFLTVFAYVTWVYRFTVFLAIALLVYHFFIKILGILMFIVECWYFILGPILVELRQWWKMRRNARLRVSNAITLTIVSMAIAAMAYPFQKTHVIPGLLARGTNVPIYAEMSGRIASLLISNGASIDLGDPIFVLENPEVNHEYKQASLNLEAASLQFANSQITAGGVGRVERSAVLHDEQNILLEAARRAGSLTFFAPQDAERLEFTDDYAVGDLIREGELIGWLHSGGDWYISLDIPVALRRHLNLGQSVRLLAPAAPSLRLVGRITQLSDIPTMTVSNWELQDLLRDNLSPQSNPREPKYLSPHLPARIDVVEGMGLYQTPVSVVISAERESLIFGIYRKIYNIIVREAEF